MNAPETLLDAVRDLFAGEQRGYYDLPKSAFVEAVHAAYVRERLAADAVPDVLAALALFVADDRFVCKLGGNPDVVDAAIAQAHAAYAKATGLQVSA